MFYRLKKKNSVIVEALSTPVQKAVMSIVFFEPVFAAVHFDHKINSFAVHVVSVFVWGLDPPHPSDDECTTHTVTTPPSVATLLSRCNRVAFALQPDA